MKKILKNILKHKKRTGLGARTILNAMDNVPDDITEKGIIALFSGLPSSLSEESLSVILTILEQAPDKTGEYGLPADETRAITSPLEGAAVGIHKKQDIIRAEKKRTGLGAKAIIQAGEKRPEGLTEQRITQILGGTGSTFSEAEYQYIIKVLKKAPDRKKVKGVPLGYRANANIPKEREIVPSLEGAVSGVHRKIEIIKGAKNKTGWGTKAIIEVGGQPPEGLTEKRITQILGGEIINFSEEEYQYIIQTLEKGEKRKSKRIGKTKITPEIRKQIKKEEQRTGCTVQHIVKFSSDHPDKPKHSTVNLLSAGQLVTIPDKELQFIFQQFKQRPNKKKETAVPPKVELHQNERSIPKKAWQHQKNKPISKKDLEELLMYRDQLNLLPGHIFKVCGDPPPDGLRRQMISSWLNEAVKTANPKYVNWVLQSCRDIVKIVYEKAPH